MREQEEGESRAEGEGRRGEAGRGEDWSVDLERRGERIHAGVSPTRKSDRAVSREKLYTTNDHECSHIPQHGAASLACGFAVCHFHLIQIQRSSIF